MSRPGPGRLRIKVVCPFGTRGGGAEEWLLSILENTDELDVSAIVLADGPLVAALQEHCQEVSILPTGRSSASVVAASVRIGRLLAANPPQVVVGNGVKAQLAVAPAAFRRWPTLWVKHDHSFDRIVARSLGALSTCVMSTALEVGLPVGRGDLIVIEPARPAPPLPVPQARSQLAQLGVPDDGRLRLAMLSRLVPYKGVDVAISALAEPGVSDWRLVVVGDDDASTPGETDRLRQLASGLGVGGRVDFLGRVPNAGRLLPGVEALAVLTRPDGPRTPSQEGYGITATEAMLAGIPVIMAGSGPIARRLGTSSGPAGLVVPQSDPSAVAAALKQLASARVRTEMGSCGIRVAEILPDAAGVAEAFVRALRETSLRGPAGCRR
jgi:glycosyltransferase involved in cell wall biosynthesis